MMRWQWQFEDEQLGVDSTPPQPIAKWRKPLLFVVSGGWVLILVLVVLILWALD